MEKGKSVVTLYAVFLLMALSSSSGTAENFKAGAAIETRAAIRNNHEVKANYYENAAREMQTKGDEKKSLLKHYEVKSYLYGRRAQDLKSGTRASVRKYDRATKINRKEAQLHRQMAQQLVAEQS